MKFWLLIPLVGLQLFMIGAYTRLREDWKKLTFTILSIGVICWIIVANELLNDVIETIRLGK